YKAKVKTQYPKTLEDAIKSAQIFYDTHDKSFDRSMYKSAFQSSTFKNGKRKNHVVVSNEDSTKKAKVAKGPLSSNELARARRESGCVIN
ncbi:hypothetical protein, partial [Escherichia coli]|uniref:hypothetical protein n=1 Tax=Escherichia coli TaxID=562 RepID=UPI00142E54AF